MIRSAAGKVMWVGRATVFMVGLAVILALVFGVATSALGANGKPFLLGKRNVASAISTLIKQGPGPALNLQVGAGQPPLAVNSKTRVANLNAATAGRADTAASADTAANADKLDGEVSGAYLPGDLPSGTTVRGNFYFLSDAPNGEYLGQGISFGYRLPSAPIPHYIKVGETVPEACSLDAGSPEAAPGHLCVFETEAASVTGIRGVDHDATTRQGSGVYIMSAGPSLEGGRPRANGTWAVTAP